MRRITKRDCSIQLDFINTKLLQDKVNVEVKENGNWKNLYQSGNLIVSARTWVEMYYQLVAFKHGIQLAMDEKIGV